MFEQGLARTHCCEVYLVMSGDAAVAMVEWVEVMVLLVRFLMGVYYRLQRQTLRDAFYGQLQPLSFSSTCDA